VKRETGNEKLTRAFFFVINALRSTFERHNFIDSVRAFSSREVEGLRPKEARQPVAAKLLQVSVPTPVESTRLREILQDETSVVKLHCKRGNAIRH